ncbi:bifunctional lysylphosphatidylglycerol flippase/synthetase MprF [Amnibacterium flavum]|uniref:Phosphatidylglycerol lysyltransferase C-terminal domain-containing protein n=1 Tax=Amnibacterium flavum TaxID=2173173 RepID=A0A2V1HT33_9MICO|nr:DUF2156 domain-containing protein [Amnibacterium flavum]PVZ94120.1 hypothetical protein DDQ50_10245 [Amnibacterium flavum]
MRTAWETLRRSAVTVSVTLVILVATLATGSLFGAGSGIRDLFGTSPSAFVRGIGPLTAVSSVLIADGLGPLLLTLLAVPTLVGLSERLMGHWRTLAVYGATAVLGISGGVLVQTLRGAIDGGWPMGADRAPVFDPLTPVVGTIMVASAFAEQLWRRRIRVLGVWVLVLLLLFSGQPADLYRLVAAGAGLLLGVVLAPAERRWMRIARSSHHEARTLSAALVLSTALAPLISIVTAVPYGPVHPLSVLLGARPPESGACDVAVATRACVDLLALERLSSPGGVLLALLPLGLLALTVFGLLRGRRAAVWIAVAVSVWFSFLAVLYNVVLVAVPDGGQLAAGSNGFSLIDTLLIVFVPLVLAVLLVTQLKHFPVRSSHRSRVLFRIVVGGAFVLTGAIYLTVGVVSSDQFEPPVTFVALLLDLPERYMPPGFLSLRLLEFVPDGALAEIGYAWVGPVFWTAVLVASAFVMASTSSQVRATDRERVRALLERGSTGSLSHMATWQGHEYWFTADGSAAVAYRVVSGVAITTGGPIGSVESRWQAVRDFSDFCDENGWTPAFYSVDDELLPVFGELGWTSTEVGDDAIIRPANFTLAGGRWKDVRTSMNRAAKLGVTAEWTTWAELSLATRSQIEAISEEWVAGRNLPEMGFTLGGVDELADPEVRLMLAVTETGAVLAATSWMPTFRDGVLVGWTLDFMRRRPSSMNGVIEFLIAATVLRAQHIGLDFVSLSAAPLSRAGSPGDDSGLAQQVLGYVGRRLESLYGFRSLLAFKLKFGPEFRPISVAYQDPMELPAIGMALARAYLPAMTMPQAVAIMRALVRPTDASTSLEREQVPTP